MAVARFNVKKAGEDRYRLVFESEKGKIVCEVPANSPTGRSGTDEDRRAAALTRARLLSRAFHEAIPER